MYESYENDQREIPMKTDSPGRQVSAHLGIRKEKENLC